MISQEGVNDKTKKCKAASQRKNRKPKIHVPQQKSIEIGGDERLSPKFMYGNLNIIFIVLERE